MEIANTYRSTTHRAARRHIQTAVVIEHRELVAKIVAGLVPVEHRTEGEQVGALGVLVALERYDPANGEAFADLVMAHAGREVETWLASGRQGVEWLADDTAA